MWDWELHSVRFKTRKEKPVYFISRKLHANKTAFSSSELETLTVVWAVERLHQYLYGRHFEIRTNHSALKEVLTGGRENSVAPARISRWAARLLPYSFKVHYIKGCSNVVADCLSRLPSESCGNFFDFNINIATMHGDMLPCVTMMELSHATAEDPILQKGQQIHAHEMAYISGFRESAIFSFS